MKKIRVQHLYSILVLLLAGIALPVMFLYVFYGELQTTGTVHLGDEWYQVCGNLIICAVIFFLDVFCFFQGVMNIEYATIDDAGIKIRNPFGIVLIINWKDVSVIDLEKLRNGDSAKSVELNWIVIRTYEFEKTELYTAERNSVFEPCHICANKRNIRIIKQFAKIYCKNASVML